GLGHQAVAHPGLQGLDGPRLVARRRLGLVQLKRAVREMHKARGIFAALHRSPRHYSGKPLIIPSLAPATKNTFFSVSTVPHVLYLRFRRTRAARPHPGP